MRSVVPSGFDPDHAGDRRGGRRRAVDADPQLPVGGVEPAARDPPGGLGREVVQAARAVAGVVRAEGAAVDEGRGPPGRALGEAGRGGAQRHRVVGRTPTRTTPPGQRPDRGPGPSTRRRRRAPRRPAPRSGGRSRRRSCWARCSKNAQLPYSARPVRLSSGSAGIADLALGEVLPVVVDAVGVPLLDPGGGGLHQPRVLAVVVAELDGVEELVGGGDPQRLDRPAPELAAGEVVVEDAVARARRRPRPDGSGAQ